MNCHHPLCAVVPHTPPNYGVFFGLDGKVNKAANLSPRSLAAAVLHVVQYEEGFVQFGATGHIVDLTTGQEVYFDRNALLHRKEFRELK